MAAPSGAAAPGRAAGSGLPLPGTAPQPGTPFLESSALAGDGSKAWFADQHSAPRLFVCEDAWFLLANAGEWNSGAWQSTVDTYLSQRAAQGYTALEISVFSYPNPDSVSNFSDGRDWDGTWPFTSTNDPSSGFSAVFWARRDYLFTRAAANGISVFVNASTPSLGLDAFTASWTTTQWQDYGTGLGARYAAGFPNVFWLVGDDYFGTIDTQLAAFLTSLRAAGDTHLFSVQNYQEATSRLDIFTLAKDPLAIDVTAQFEWGYSYNPSYDVVEKAQTYAPTGSDDVQSLVPPL